MYVIIEWQSVSDELWNEKRALYAYLTPDGKKIMYIGKAYRTSVRGRWRRQSKSSYWDWVEKEHGVHEHAILVAAKEHIRLPDGSKISEQLVTDIESLLIKRIQPEGNVQNIKSRKSRKGLKVICEGVWPFEKKEFWDIG